MKKTDKFSPEFRERAVRMVNECRADHPSLWSAVESIPAKIGCPDSPADPTGKPRQRTAAAPLATPTLA